MPVHSLFYSPENKGICFESNQTLFRLSFKFPMLKHAHIHRHSLRMINIENSPRHKCVSQTSNKMYLYDLQGYFIMSKFKVKFIILHCFTLLCAWSNVLMLVTYLTLYCGCIHMCIMYT